MKKVKVFIDNKVVVSLSSAEKQELDLLKSLLPTEYSDEYTDLEIENISRYNNYISSLLTKRGSLNINISDTYDSFPTKAESSSVLID